MTSYFSNSYMSPDMHHYPGAGGVGTDLDAQNGPQMHSE